MPRPGGPLLATLPAPDARSLTWTVRTEVFDGPLDLLLHLVRRDGIDLRRVSISQVCDSYHAFLGRMRDLHISVASEYLVMAATLCYLKSLEILPRPPAILEDEEVDPREALARRLETYEAFRLAAEKLEARPRLGRDVFTREPLDVGEVDRPLVPGVDAFRLLDLYHAVLTRPPPVEPTHTIHRPEIDLTACAASLLRTLGGVGGRAFLGDVLRAVGTRAERVVTFLAVLEMCRLGWVGLAQSHHLAEVEVACRVAADHPLDQLVGAVRVEAEASA